MANSEDYWGSFQDTYNRMDYAFKHLGPTPASPLPKSVAIPAPLVQAEYVDFIRPEYFLTTQELRPWQAIPDYYKVKRGKLLAVSHRWDLPTHPDPFGAKLAFLRALSYANPTSVIFFDYCSMPQPPRRHLLEQQFARGLTEVHKIFSRGKLVIFATDDTYFDRAWCLLELYCHLLSPTEKELAVLSLDNPTFVAHLCTVIEGEKYAEDNAIDVDGWRARIMDRVRGGDTTLPADKLTVLGIMAHGFRDTAKISTSRKGCIEVCTPRGSMYLVVN
jgi:hypothetical protein